LPYERLKKYGVDNLTNRDLLAIILRTGSSQMNVLETAAYLLDHPFVKTYGISGLLKLSKEDLMSVPGIGWVKTSQLLSIFELSKRIREQSATDKVQFNCSKDVAEFYMDRMRYLEKEHVIGVFLDRKRNKIAEEVISVGTLTASLLNPREVFKLAFKYNASKIILLHNHPSGDPRPSKEDTATTLDFVLGAKLLALEIEDHIIIGDNRYYSMKDSGII